MAGEVSAAQIGEHITMPVAILSDGDDAGLVCDHVAAKIMCRCLGCCFRTGREQPVSGGSAAWEPKVRRLSPVEGDGFEPSVPRRNKLCVAPATNVPGRDDPLRRQLGSGCKAELDQPTTLRRVRLARIRVWRS